MIIKNVHFNNYKLTTWIEVKGDDAFQYLQSQCSNDLHADGNCIYTFFLNEKGKVSADAFVLSQGENDFKVLSYYCSSETVVQRLEKNIVADAVEVTDNTQGNTGIALWGEEAHKVIASLDLEIPEKNTFTHNNEVFIFPGRHSRQLNYDWILPKKNAQDILENLKALGCQEATESQLHAERINSLIPAIPQDIGPDNFPNEGNLETIGVSYNKGCYLGQEVMSRLHSIGKLRRALYQVETQGLVQTLPQTIYHQDKKVGELRSIFKNDNEGKSIGLALLKKQAIEKNSVTLNLFIEGQTGVKIIAKV